MDISSVLNANWGAICTPLELVALDGKKSEIKPKQRTDEIVPKWI